jgi:hypothetical protein
MTEFRYLSGKCGAGGAPGLYPGYASHGVRARRQRSLHGLNAGIFAPVSR